MHREAAPQRHLRDERAYVRAMKLLAFLVLFVVACSATPAPAAPDAAPDVVVVSDSAIAPRPGDPCGCVDGSVSLGQLAWVDARLACVCPSPDAAPLPEPAVDVAQPPDAPTPPDAPADGSPPNDLPSDVADAPGDALVDVAPDVGCLDRDHDGYGLGPTCAGPDCDDTDPTIHPRAPERCNGRDDDCNGRGDVAGDPDLNNACEAFTAWLLALDPRYEAGATCIPNVSPWADPPGSVLPLVCRRCRRETVPDGGSRRACTCVITGANWSCE